MTEKPPIFDLSEKKKFSESSAEPLTQVRNVGIKMRNMDFIIQRGYVRAHLLLCMRKFKGLFNESQEAVNLINPCMDPTSRNRR